MAAVTPTIAELLNGDTLANLQILLQDTNGDYVYSNEKALYGFIKASEYLVIPEFLKETAMTIPKAKAIPNLKIEVIGGIDNIKGYLGASAIGKEYVEGTAYQYYNDPVLFHKIAFMNFAHLTSGGMNAANAFVCSALRSRWIQLGALDVTLTDTSKPIDEITVVAEDESGTILEKISAAQTMSKVFETDLALAALYMKEMASESHGVRWIVQTAETIWCAEEHVMRVRGHHYKDSYATLLDKYVDACNEGAGKIPTELDKAALFRTSIHPFGISALPVLAAHFAIHGKLANAGIIRFNGAPNGMAVITTTAACIRAMAAEPWYNQFITVYGERIKLLEAMETAIMSNKYGYHMSSKLYNAKSDSSITISGVSYNADKMREVGGHMAAIAQGFIMAMREAMEAGEIPSFSFSNAKAMEKHAATNPLSTIRIKNLVIFAIESILNAKTVSAATAAALPTSTAQEAVPA